MTPETPRDDSQAVLEQLIREVEGLEQQLAALDIPRPRTVPGWVGAAIALAAQAIAAAAAGHGVQRRLLQYGACVLYVRELALSMPGLNREEADKLLEGHIARASTVRGSAMDLLSHSLNTLGGVVSAWDGHAPGGDPDGMAKVIVRLSRGIALAAAAVDRSVGDS
jgi:hypothetical protein